MASEGGGQARPLRLETGGATASERRRPLLAVSGISGVSSRQWIFSLSCTRRRKKNRSTPITSTPTPITFSFVPP